MLCDGLGALVVSFGQTFPWTVLTEEKERGNGEDKWERDMVQLVMGKALKTFILFGG